MKRVFDPAQTEMMDRKQPVSEELQRDLRNLEALNRYFGSHRLMRSFLRCWLQRGGRAGVYRILDLATGGGDLPRMMVQWARSHGVAVKIDAVDAQSSTLEIARDWSVNYPEISYIEGDVRSFQALPKYDLVCCSLALHHFSEDDAVLVLERAKALSRDKVLVADLERTCFTQFSVYLLTATYFNEPMTRHDARLSVKRAFSFDEMADLAARAGWENFGHQRFFPARQAIWINSLEAAAEVSLAVDMDYAT